MTDRRWMVAAAALAALGSGACTSILGDFEGSGGGSSTASTGTTTGAGGASSTSTSTSTSTTTGSMMTTTGSMMTTSTTSGMGGAGGTGGHGGAGGTAGHGGMGGGVVSADAGILQPAATDTVSAGQLAQSASFVMVSTVGQSTQNQEQSTSQSFVMQGGLVGAIGSQP